MDLMIIFNQPRKTTGIQRVLLQMKISHVVFCSRTITQKSIRYVGYKMWNDLPIELKSNSRLSFNNLQYICKKN